MIHSKANYFVFGFLQLPVSRLRGVFGLAWFRFHVLVLPKWTYFLMFGPDGFAPILQNVFKHRRKTRNAPPRAFGCSFFVSLLPILLRSVSISQPA